MTKLITRHRQVDCSASRKAPSFAAQGRVGESAQQPVEQVLADVGEAVDLDRQAAARKTLCAFAQDIDVGRARLLALGAVDRDRNGQFEQ